MAYSENKFTTGLSGLDDLLHGLRPGDNVVLQTGSIDEYRPFVEPFYKTAVSTGNKLIYFRFARHQDLIDEGDGVEIYRLHPEDGFERFITETIEIITKAGRGACYVFDCLSELAVDWYSDRMLGNFFMLVCPYLYRLDTIAYFAVLRNNHSSLAIDAISNTAQVVMSVYGHKNHLYIQPLKVDQRQSPRMYMLHQWDADAFIPLNSSGLTAEILTRTPQPWLDFTIHRPEVWMRTFTKAEEALVAIRRGDAASEEFEMLHDRLLRMAITRQESFIDLVRKYLPLSRLISILQRMIGTGLIGGKSLGMLLSRAILEEKDTDWREKLEPHDSFFIGSDVFYTFLVQNDCWWLRYGQNKISMQEMLENASIVREKMLTGTFPADIRHQFEEMLNYFGQCPIIIRSSSLLEDNYGNAFSGKYESVFCANQGSPEERMAEFLNAVRTVYASTMSYEALTYRAERGLLEHDEQMALLVQRVSGNFIENYFLPHIAGVGFSFNMYAWDPKIDPDEGLLRLVFGLGTRAVDRTAEDYTRVVALSAPGRRPEGSGDEAAKYRQRFVDLLALSDNAFVTEEADQILSLISDPPRRLLAEGTRRPEDFGRMETPYTSRPSWQLSFDRLFRETSLISDMKDLLTTLQQAYGNPVDVEFTANFSEDGTYRLNLVQCRPLQVEVAAQGEHVRFPESVKEENVLFKTAGPVIGRGLVTGIDRLVYVVPEEYAELSMQERYAVARAIGEVMHLAGENRAERILLMGPGRWGTRSPSLGVPVRFSEINTATAVCELACMREGLVPDISLGTHFFNDLVEMDMVYVAVFPEKEGNRVNFERLISDGIRANELFSDVSSSKAAGVIRIIDSEQLKESSSLYFYADPLRQKGLCILASNMYA
ncbi:MAG: PEP/pyruvate-binding domain-containing protein [Lentisphaeria bacterium]